MNREGREGREGLAGWGAATGQRDVLFELLFELGEFGAEGGEIAFELGDAVGVGGGGQ